MDRERPPYLDNVPRDRRGNWTMYLLAAALLAALIGGWKIYARTVAAWSDRFENPQPTPNQQINAERRRQAQADEAQRQIALERIRAEREAVRAEQQLRQLQQLQTGELRCVNGTLLRKLPNGWENVPGERC